MNHPLEFWRGGFGPWRDTQFQKAVDRLFSGDLAALPLSPSCEVSESKASYLVKIDLPGVGKDQIKIDLHDGVLTIAGERRDERASKPDEEGRRHFSEVSYGSFSRAFSFPAQVDPERVEARFDAGVLSVTVPKTEATRARQISIK